ncbi:MAG: phosphatase PAP2 family protein [Eubacteriales bacterium]|nr:phosphatase PAP2 family protein [Eubacteriales bacterium]
MTEKVRSFLQKYPYAWVVSYFIFYLAWFVWVESRASKPYHVIHFPLDDYIPFCEYFIVPYLLWFVYIGAVYVWLFLKDRERFFRYIAVLYTGMTLFLIVSTVYPNGHLLRPTEFDSDSIFIRLVCFIYWADTSTNILPSIHVFNSIAAHTAVMRTPGLRDKKWTVWGSRILCVSIILSTMFLKQHSCVDVISGILLAAAMNYAVYRTGFLVKAHDLVGKLVGHHRYFSPAFSRKIHRAAKDAEI